MQILKLKQFANALKPRPRDAHKGDFGHLLIVGGAPGYAGAVMLAAEAALRTGAGRVSVATHPDHAAMLTGIRPEVMCHGIHTRDQLAELMAKATVLVLGPGLGRSGWSEALFDEGCHFEKDMIVDADGLNRLSDKPAQKSNWILTPHPGEAGRLLKKSAAAVQQDRFSAVTELQQAYQGWVVLKGAGTWVKGPDSAPELCEDGNPGMATAGMGDVLSGVLGGLAAQGLPLGVVARLGVLLHAMAGDLAAKKGERGMIASDLMCYLRELVNRFS
ncbi:MAG TPA: NAD(P)H-hydrate dehydratase [Gammaproteobacteria bacterium]|nr:NAD(P)H-hydrate dehydratase [Gammaproteobacteria bacterium]